MLKISGFILLLLICILVFNTGAAAQCSICAKTVMQMGNKPAHGFNSGIVYLMVVPYVAIGVIGYQWWKNEKRKS
jgi:hypothetical protein